MPNNRLRSLEAVESIRTTASRGATVPTRGRPSAAMLDVQVREALRFLDDPIGLEDLALIRLPVVANLAVTKFRGRTCAVGLALRQVLQEILEALASDLEGTPVGALAGGLRHGLTQAEVARQLGLSDEYLCRRWKPQLVRLVREQLTMQRGAECAAA